MAIRSTNIEPKNRVIGVRLSTLEYARITEYSARIKTPISAIIRKYINSLFEPVAHADGVDQRTPGWFEIRAGKFTASRISDLMGVKGIGKTGETYIIEKVAEELGAIMPDISTYAMRRGTELEPEAKQFYCDRLGVTLIDQPFIVAPWCDDAGASPDGIVSGENRGIELKCSINPIHHIKRFSYRSQEDLKVNEPGYYWQVQMCMAVTGLRLWDFVSYYPEIGDDYKMVVVTIAANDADIELLKLRIAEAVEMKHRMLKEIQL